MRTSTRTTSLFNIVSEVRGGKLTEVGRTDWRQGSVIETMYSDAQRDDELEEKVDDRISFNRFVGLSPMSPDSVKCYSSAVLWPRSASCTECTAKSTDSWRPKSSW